MLKIQEIREIIKLIDQTGIEEFKYKTEEGEIKLKKGGAVQVVEAAPAAPAASVSAPAPTAPAAPATQPAPAAQEEPKQQEAAPAAASQDENLLEVKSPMVGTFYQSPSPDAPPFVSVGDKVKPDSVVCIVEAMKLFNEIEAEMSGEIAKILVEDGQLVEYGQPLFLVKPE